MKTRVLTALEPEPASAGFESTAARNRLQPPPRIHGTAAPQVTPPPAEPARNSQPAETQTCHSFASLWRKKSLDSFIPFPRRKWFFHCLTAAIAGLGMSFLAGCKSSESTTAAYAQLSMESQPQPAGMQMLTVTNRLDPSLLRTPTNLFTLGPGDKLDIELVDETNSLSSTVVGPDGKIYFNLLPGVDVWGLTLGQTRQVLERDMEKYERGQPQINVTLRDVESKHVWMLGRFERPGIYNLAAPTTLLEAIATAGGSQSFAGQRQISEGGPLGEDLADLHHSFIVRNGKMLPVDFYALLDKGDLSQNIYLKPDDFVYFAPAYAKEVYVLGAVTLPQPIQYVTGMTLMQAIAGAYGTVRDAYLAHVTIIRGSLATPQVAFVNYYDIVKGRTPDIALEPNDIVYVPLTRYRYLRKYLDIALNTFVTSVALNEGTKISTPRGSATTGVIIPAGSGIQIIPPGPLPGQ